MYYVTVSDYKSNRMGEQLAAYVKENYDHAAVAADEIQAVKADIEKKMAELQSIYKRCKPFRLVYFTYRDLYGVDCPHITVRPDTENERVAVSLGCESIRHLITAEEDVQPCK